MTPSEAVARLESAVRAVASGRDTGPGRWDVHRYGDDVYLVYIVEAPGGVFSSPTPESPFRIWEVSGSDPTEPWDLWGGDDILAMAGLEVEHSGTLMVHGTYGEEYHDWVSVRLDPDPDPGECIAW